MLRKWCLCLLIHYLGLSANLFRFVSNMPVNLENSAVPTGLEKVSFHSNTKEGQCQRMFYHTLVLISYASKVILKILHACLQQYVNWELPDVQAGFRKSRGTRDQIANIWWIIERARDFQENIYFFFIDYAKPSTLWITTNYGKFLKRWECQTTLPVSLVAQMIKNLLTVGETWFWSLDWEDPWVLNLKAGLKLNIQKKLRS